MSISKISVDEQMKIIMKGVDSLIDEKDLKEKLTKAQKEDKPLVIKLGLDPSAPDIHLGHTVVLRKMKQLQDLGHQVVIIIGDFTGKIGDPTGKSKTRKALTTEQVLENAKTYQEQIFKVLDKDKTIVRYNSEWLGKLNFEEVIKFAKERGPKTISVACCQDKEVLLAVEMARKEGIANAILVGDIAKTEPIAKELGIDLANYELINIEDLVEASRKAVELVSSGKADMVMKGIVDTSIVLKAVLDKEIGLRTGKVLSHVAVFDVNGFDRLFFITDAAMNLAPDVAAKKQIIENAVDVAHALDIEVPNVACLCAKEKVNPKMKDTVEAAELQEMCEKGEITGCVVGGPFALDNAVSEEAAAHKGVNHPGAGKADILLVPDIEAGNVLYKSMVFFAQAKNAGVIVGAKAPVILTSRADTEETKLNSIALGVLMAAKTAK